jgi:hypothetical protein
MQRNRSWWARWLASGILALGLIGSPAVVRAQEPEPAASGDSKGRPLDGYIATGMLCFLALFIIGKTARR